MHPRPLELERDMPAVAGLLGRARADGSIWSPGGIEWWLRELVADRHDFEAWVWRGGDDAAAFVMIDGTMVIAERSDAGPSNAELLDWAEDRLRAGGRASIDTSVAYENALRPQLLARGYLQGEPQNELMFDRSDEHTPVPAPPELPGGYSMVALDDIGDEAFIDLHRAAWSDKHPSTYTRERHAAVKRMPHFRADLVTIAIAPDGTPAAYCIGWLDETSATLEIEPLGTHRDFRRLGLATAVVHEVARRAWENGAQHVLVWNERSTNEGAYRLYTRAGMTTRRDIVNVSKTLGSADAHATP